MSTNNLIILFKESTNHHILEHSRKHSITKLINFTNVSEIDFSDIENIDYSSHSGFQEFYSNSLEEYLSFVGNNSKHRCNGDRTLRDIKIFNLSLYWLIPFSEKHLYNHWCFNFFLVKNYLKKYGSTNQSYYILIPPEYSHLKNFFTKNIVEKHSNVKLLSFKENKKISFFRLIANHISSIRKVVICKSKKDLNEDDVKYIICLPKEGSYYTNNLFKKLVEEKIVENSKIADFKVFNWNYYLPVHKLMSKSKPSIIDMLKLMYLSINCFFFFFYYKKVINIFVL